MSKRFVAAIAGLVALSALAYFSLVKDWFVPRTLLAGYFAVATSSELNLSHIDEWNQAARDRYGSGVSTAIRGQNWEAYVGDKIVETRAVGSSNARAYGVFLASRKDRFPFELSVDPQHITDLESTTDAIKARFSGTIPSRALEFGPGDWRLAHCHSPGSSGFGIPLVGSFARMGPTDVCLVRLNAEGSGTFVVGYAVVYGNSWIRLFSRRICRTLSVSWIDSIMSRPGVKRPDYVGCILADKPGEEAGKASETLSPYFFEVREDKTLAAF